MDERQDCRCGRRITKDTHIRIHITQAISVVHKCVTYVCSRGISSVYCIDQMLPAGVADTHMYLREWYMVCIAIYFANVQYLHV